MEEALDLSSDRILNNDDEYSSKHTDKNNIGSRDGSSVKSTDFIFSAIPELFLLPFEILTCSPVDFTRLFMAVFP